MTLADWLFHPAMYSFSLIPLTVLIVAIAASKKLTWPMFARFAIAEAVFLALLSGIIFGPQWPQRLASAWTGNWAGVLNIAIILIYSATMLFAIGKLGKNKKFDWIPMGMAAYFIGSWIHLGVAWTA